MLALRSLHFVPAAVVAQAKAPPPPAPTGALAPVDKIEIKDPPERTKAIEHMLRGNDPPLSAEERKRVDGAFRAFSTKEIQRMDKVGVRVWRGGGVPPDMKEANLDAAPLRTKAAYSPGIKLVRLNPSAPPSTSDIRHELGHVKDDLLAEPKGSKPITEVKEKDRPKVLAATMELGTESKTKYATKAPGADGKLKDAKLTLGQMYEAFEARTAGYPKDLVFGSPTAREGYARRSAQEFFAEAFAVFHGLDDKAQARLLEQAPELYFFLEADAKKNGLPVPDKAALAKIDTLK